MVKKKRHSTPVASAASQQPKPEMNVTPLVDVTLVLLIIFMVVAPALAQGEHITLPDAVNADQAGKEMNPIEVVMPGGDEVIVDKQRHPRSELRRWVAELHQKDQERRVLLATDGAVPYGQVRGALKTLQEVGFRGVAIKVTENKKKGGK